MQIAQIGQQLRAYRLESGLSAEEIAARLGISRAALYRYEKGEVIKLGTVKRLAELLNISPLSLLGIGIEYYTKPAGYFERISQIEETADQLLHVSGALSPLIASDAYDALLGALFEAVVQGGELPSAQHMLAVMGARKQLYRARRPGIIVMIPLSVIQRLLLSGIGGGLPLPDALRARCRSVAADEVAHIASLLDSEPMGLQFGLLTATEPTSTFELLRSRDRAMLAINPFHPETGLHVQSGVAMITGAEDAIATHQRVAESLWREAVKGSAAASLLREALRVFG